VKERLGEVTLNLLRIVAGFLFLAHGAQKLFGVWGREAVELAGLLGLAGVLEFFGGLLILLGLLTRPVAFVLAGQMAVAYWMAHGPKALMPIENGGELAALYCFVFLFLFANGGGSFSVDGWLRRRKS
jgi:putative oxidoreductase